MGEHTPTILVVDDVETNIDVLVETLGGYFEVAVATNGVEALEAVTEVAPDVILLDVMMPEMDGYEACRRLKANPDTADIPVLFLTARDQVRDELRGLELGASDYITKPFNPPVVLARVRTQLALVAARRKTEELLLNILPKTTVSELKEHGEAKPVAHESATILFLDLVNFTAAVSKLDPLALIRELNDIYTVFDNIVAERGCERVKTIGDCYMAAGGIPDHVPDHAVRVVLVARDMRDYLLERAPHPVVGQWSARVGIHTGPVVAGIVGFKRFAFDVFGDSVNIASRIEHAAAADEILVSQTTARLLPSSIPMGPQRVFVAKGKGELHVRPCFPRQQ